MSSDDTDLNSAGNSALTSSTTSKESFEIQESFPFFDGHPQVFAKIDRLLAETFDEVPSTVTSNVCQSSADADEELPWYRQKNVLVIDGCLITRPEWRKPSLAPDLALIDEGDDEVVEEECQVFPDFDIPLLGTMILLPIAEYLSEDLCFTETLMICHQNLSDEPHTDDLDVIGSTIIQVKDGGFDKFEVFVSSSLTSREDAKLTSEIFGVTDRTLLGDHETKSETLQKPGAAQLSVKTLTLDRCGDNGYFLKSSVVRSQTQHLKRGLLKITRTGDFVLDSGNIVLLRYLVRIKFIGTFQTWTVDINGNVLRAIYSISDFQPMTVSQGICVDVKQVVRAFQGQEASGDHTISYFTSTGHLVRHIWHDCDYFLALNPLSELLTVHGVAQPVALDWQDDPRLFLDYMGDKAQKIMAYKNYVRFNETLVNLLKQYILRLVHQQPTEIVDFTLQHFRGRSEPKLVSFVGTENVDVE